MNRVGVVVLNYKGIEDTIKCVESLLAQNYSDFTIVVVENGSYDGSRENLEKLQAKHDDKLVALYNEKNLGFDGGVNTGIRWCIENDMEYVALLNNDATADKNWLQALLTAAEENESGITTSLLLLGDGKQIDSTGDFYSKWGLPFPRNRGDSTKKAPESEYVMCASGGASLYSTEMLQQIGLFDEDFFAYYEDNDISLRAQLAGYKVWYENTAIAYHHQGATANRMPGHFAVYQTFKNLPLVYVKNVPLGLLLPIGIRFTLAYWLMYANAVRRGTGLDATKGVLMAAWLCVAKIPARWRIQREKTVTTRYIKSILWNDLPPDQTGLRKLRKIITGK